MSKAILKRMYNGELYPAEKICPQSQKYQQLNQEIDMYDQLLEAINRDIPINGDISIFVYPEKK